MKRMKLVLMSALLFVSLACAAQSDTLKKESQLVWYTDIMKANEVSVATHKPLFALFTGSDWCGWCKRLQSTVLSKPAFIEWANKNVVLVELDFPRSKAQSPELMQQNQGLQQAFKVQGYPTIWVFNLSKNSDGQRYDINALGSLGYPQGAEQGKEEVKFLQDANALFEKKETK
ncbi:MAG: thioredoxin family protein [Bacteroidetes bacterium]|nr:thioredoxin family protein [Bacteroidota bacterium]